MKNLFLIIIFMSIICNSTLDARCVGNFDIDYPCYVSTGIGGIFASNCLVPIICNSYGDEVPQSSYSGQCIIYPKH